MSEQATKSDLTKSELRAAATFATIKDLNEVRAEVRVTAREMIEVKAELRDIRRVLDRMSSSIERIVWLVLAAVVGATLKQVLGL